MAARQVGKRSEFLDAVQQVAGILAGRLAPARVHRRAPTLDQPPTAESCGLAQDRPDGMASVEYERPHTKPRQ